MDKKILLENYLKEQPSAADVLNFLSVVDNAQLMLLLDELLPAARNKLNSFSLVAAFKWLKRYADAGFAGREKMVNDLMKDQYGNIRVLEKVAKKDTYIMQIDNGVYEVNINENEYYYKTREEMKCVLDCVYLCSFDEWCGKS